jgi:hypothetical protein
MTSSTVACPHERANVRLASRQREGVSKSDATKPDDSRELGIGGEKSKHAMLAELMVMRFRKSSWER